MTDNVFSLPSLGWSDRWNALFLEVAEPGFVPGRVIRRDRGWVLVATETGTVAAETGGLTEDAVTGDWLVLSGDRPAAVLARKGALRRRGPDGAEQVVAANVDTVLLVCGLDRPVKPGRIARGAIQAWDAGASPLVVLNKADLSPDPAGAVEAVLASTPGLDVFTVSCRSGEGLEAVRRAIAGSTTVLLGESGAGKSSLLNALAGRTLAAEGEVRKGDAKGRHTTTRRELHLLPGGAAVIDTPGTRSLGLAATAEAVEGFYADIDRLSEGCRFSDCSHAGEPGCAVLAAVEAGEVQAGRLESFLLLRREVESQQVRMSPHLRRRRERSFARLTREGQRAKRGRLDS